MRKNARSRWSWEPGGDLITLTVRVAGAAVVNDVIGHWPFDKERCVGTELTSYGELWDQTRAKPSTPLGYSGTATWSPISANRGRGRGRVPDSGRIGDGDGGASPPPGKSGEDAPSPSPDKSGTGTGTGTGVSAPCLAPPRYQVAL